MSNDRKRILSEKLLGEDFIIFDEISMVDPTFLGQASSCLAEVMGNDNLFGGKSVILVGDFFQLKPVAAKPLYSAALEDKNIIPTPKGTADLEKKSDFLLGVKAFAQFRLVEINQQVRAADDPIQIATLESLRDLTQKEFITNEILKSLLKRTLKPEDLNTPTPLHDSLDTWSNAPVCVTSNQERNNLTPVLALQLAKVNRVPLVTWNKPCTGSLLDLAASEMSNNRPELKEALFSLESGLVDIFVQGAPKISTLP